MFRISRTALTTSLMISLFLTAGCGCGDSKDQEIVVAGKPDDTTPPPGESPEGSEDKPDNVLESGSGATPGNNPGQTVTPPAGPTVTGPVVTSPSGPTIGPASPAEASTIETGVDEAVPESPGVAAEGAGPPTVPVEAPPPAAPLPEAPGAIDATPPPDTTPPLVTSTRPVNNEEAASIKWPIVAIFSEEIDCSTVTSSTFKMTLAGDEIRGTPSCGRNMVQFDPADLLQFDTTYTARLTTGIRDLAGNRLPMDYSWSFTMAEGGWRGADSIDDEVGLSANPTVAASGETFAAAWLHTTSLGVRVAWSKSTGGGLWDDLRVIGFGEGWDDGWGVASTPDISVQQAGLAYLTWSELYKGRQVVRGFATAFGGPEPLSYQLAGGAFCPQVAAAPGGSAIVVWRQVSSGMGKVYARRFDPVTRLWTDGAVELPSRDGATDYNALCPQVAVDGEGNAFVVWETLRTGGSFGPVFSHRFDAALSRWEGGRVIAESYERGPQLAVSANGDAFVAWRAMHPDWPNNWEVWVKRYSPGTGWELGRTRVTDTYLPGADSPTGAEVMPRLAVDPYGNAILVGRERVPSGRYNIYAIRFLKETEEWGEYERISTDEEENDRYLTTALDPYGNAFVVWVRTEEGRQRLYARRSLPSGIWAPRVALDELLDGNAGNPQLAVNSRGEGSVVWTQTEEPGNVKVMGNFFGEVPYPRWTIRQPDRAWFFRVAE